MAHVIKLLVILMTVAAVGPAFGQDADDAQMREGDTRTISVTVRIVLPDEDDKHPDEQAIPELPFVLYARADDTQLDYLSVTLSDVDGVVHFDAVEVPDEYERMFFSAYFPRQSPHFDREALREYRQIYDTMRRAYYWPRFCRGCVRPFITLKDGVSDYEMRIELLRSVVLTGGIERAGGGPMQRAPVWARLANSRTNTDLNGRIPGLVVPKGVPNEVFVREFPIITSHLVRREETLTNTNLGLISIPFMERSVAFDGTLKRRLELREQRLMNAERVPGSSGVTIISQDGEVILTWMTGVHGQHGSERLTEEWEVPIYAPPGTYYVAPGVFNTDETQLGLLDLIRAGVDLTDSDIPRVVLKEGEYGGMHEFDAVEMDQAIRNAMREHLESENDE